MRTTVVATAPATTPEPGLVLAKATVRAGALLGLTGKALADITGASEATISRVARNQRPLVPHSKEGQLATLLVRLYRSLDALVGNDADARIAWMRSHNAALNGIPAELIRSPEGLVHAVAYVDGMRATL